MPKFPTESHRVPVRKKNKLAGRKIAQNRRNRNDYRSSGDCANLSLTVWVWRNVNPFLFALNPKKLTNSMKHNITRTSVLALLTLLTLPSGAAVVLNHSFEADSVSDGNYTGSLTSWTVVASGGDPSPGYGTYNPAEADFTGAAGGGTPLGAEGSNVLTIYTDNAANAYAGVSQEITGTTLIAGNTYTLTVAIGDYKGLNPTNWHLAISTSSMSVGTYLTNFSGLGTLLTNDQFNDFSVSYTATGLEPQIGEDLKITLWGQNDDGIGGGTHVPFDNVRVAVVPEPSTAVLGMLGSLVLVRRRRGLKN